LPYERVIRSRLRSPSLSNGNSPLRRNRRSGSRHIPQSPFQVSRSRGGRYACALFSLRAYRTDLRPIPFSSRIGRDECSVHPSMSRSRGRATSSAANSYNSKPIAPASAAYLSGSLETALSKVTRRNGVSLYTDHSRAGSLPIESYRFSCQIRLAVDLGCDRIR